MNAQASTQDALFFQIVWHFQIEPLQNVSAVVVERGAHCIANRAR
jgi:hypothetical protein